ncbi:VOC family protein [Pilimelia columellifera]|uniref:VOC domain-containing protein n=1 Tax=Pilimelia columellifera subsp. columellifera TaxID=706583 RepID=A0ABN3N4U3_9ACTN
MSAQLHTLVIDAADLAATARFYQELAGFKETADTDADWITMDAAVGVRVAIQRAPDHVPPRWPDQQEAPQQFHLDLQVPDLATATERAVALGAVRLDGGSDRHVVVADPAGHPLCLCASDGATGVALADVAIDVPDGRAAARFYAAVLGQEITYEGDEGAMISASNGLPVMFQNVAGYQAPRWPDRAYPQQMHLDIEVDDVDAEQARVLAAGATTLPGGQDGDGGGFRVFADPFGHPFCLVWGQS